MKTTNSALAGSHCLQSSGLEAALCLEGEMGKVQGCVMQKPYHPKLPVMSPEGGERIAK